MRDHAKYLRRDAMEQEIVQIEGGIKFIVLVRGETHVV